MYSLICKLLNCNSTRNKLINKIDTAFVNQNETRNSFKFIKSSIIEYILSCYVISNEDQVVKDLQKSWC